MATGTVMRFLDQKGFGFIKPDDADQDVFVHFSEIRTENVSTLAQGQRVSFNVEEGPKGLKATNVEIIEA